MANDARERDLAHRDGALIGRLFSLTEHTDGLLRNGLSVRHAVSSVTIPCTLPLFETNVNVRRMCRVSSHTPCV
jgi:hypothetical protein